MDLCDAGFVRELTSSNRIGVKPNDSAQFREPTVPKGSEKLSSGWKSVPIGELQDTVGCIPPVPQEICKDGKLR